MRVTSTIKAIKDRCPEFNNRVFGAAEFGQLQDNANPESLPSAYVFTIAEYPSEDQRSENSYQQTISADIAVVCLIDNRADSRGQSSADRAEDIKESLFKALLSWSPIKDDKFAFYKYSKYNILKVTPAVLAVQFEFKCEYTISEEDTRQPIELEETTGRFDELNGTLTKNFNGGVDFIVKDKPDDKVDAQFKFKDLW